jgi:undecaprenyl diphosphate synthase
MSDKPKNSIPGHIAIVPDGNRRWAKQRGMLPWEGHREGGKVFEQVLEWSRDAGIKEVSFWAASTENLEREKNEVNFLLKLFGEMCDKFIKDQHDGKIKEKVMIRFIGNHKKLPEWLKEKMSRVMELTKDNDELILNMLVGYGGREELTQAARRIAQDIKEEIILPEDVNEEVFSKYLYLESEPDLVIRTSEQRLSGLLPWQSIYSEIIFVKDKYWPEFSKEDFEACLEEYSQRQRRYGK